MSETYRPPLWPKEVSPPGTDTFKSSALSWLWTLLPDDFWTEGSFRAHPAAAVHLARCMLLARYEETRHGYRTVHHELGELMPPAYVTEVQAAYKAEGVRLHAAACGLELVDRAMRGERLTPSSPSPGRWFPAAFWTGD